MSVHTRIIAEAGVNHNGSLDRALELVDIAAGAGADDVKFQTFVADELVSADAPKAAYQVRQTGAEESQREMLRKLELSRDDQRQLIARCEARGIRFLSTPFDPPSLTLLAADFRLPELKIGSGELTNLPFLLDAARHGVKLIISTGMGTLAEVEQALAIVGFAGTRAADAQPGGDWAAEVLADAAAQAYIRDHATLLHCVSDYPANDADINLRAMETLATFGVPVGYSDHSRGTAIAIAAVARGACMIEKHFTTDRTLPGPDHAASLEPGELARMIADIRAVEQAVGAAGKRPVAAEIPNRTIVRKSLVAVGAIARGTPFAAANIAIKRPGGGRPPALYWATLGTPATRDYADGEPIDL